jgi:YesN/AraC family two-component response regulator
MENTILPKAWESLATSNNYLPVIVKTIERVFDEKWSMIPNKHEFFELVYVKKGEGVFEIINEPVNIGANDILIIKPDTKHKLTVKSQSKCEFIVLNFKFNNIDEKEICKISLESFLDFVKSSKTGSYMKLKVSQKNYIITILNKILREIKDNEIGSELLNRLYVLELFILISRVLKSEWENSMKTESGKLKELVEASVSYINKNFDREISVSDISKYIFLSTSYFTKIFKEYMNVSPHNYLLDIRINRAKELILNTDSKICDIALNVGFSNQQRFNEIFKKRVGITPLKYRKKSNVNN